jgi:hypothetical protein
MKRSILVLPIAILSSGGGISWSHIVSVSRIIADICSQMCAPLLVIWWMLPNGVY